MLQQLMTIKRKEEKKSINDDGDGKR